MDYTTLTDSALLERRNTDLERIQYASIKQSVLRRIKRDLAAGISPAYAIGTELTDSLEAERHDREHLDRIDREFSRRRAQQLDLWASALEVA